MRVEKEEARKGMTEGGIPIGSVLVRNTTIIGRGHNRRVQQENPMIHAEIDCLMQAGRIGSYGNTVLYSTLMPCFLCAGAAVQFGIKKVIVAESRNFLGARAFMEEHGIEVVDLDDREWAAFFGKWCREHPKLWNEDIGED
ncbi:nucleoside deaminase [Methanoregula sp.]|uniref:nucleoside deaminase n=1 Tax=Methanoregula sp. TaxID=2052170 RepID=UPI0025EC6B94|nr:nucleoside deaminase [Methanoregula sp.]